MSSGTITGTVTTRVTLGAGGYGSTLTIASGGAVLPAAPGANGIIGPVSLAHATVINTGVVAAGAGRFAHGHGTEGGTGIILEGRAADIANTGTIAGGAGGYGAAAYGGAGGSGVVLLRPGFLSNAGTIEGGAGGGAANAASGGAGGAGVYLKNGGVVHNSGAILGGAADMAGGGAGVVLGQGGVLVNSGTIAGGASATGSGANGVRAAGAEIVNSGTITGGAGAAGVYLNGGTLIAFSGMIAGGQGADAVQLGTALTTLQIDPHARFAGAIAADASAGDTLLLGGKGVGTLSGLGSSVTGFAAVRAEAGAVWTIAGPISGPDSVTADADATLKLNGAVTVSSVGFGGADATIWLGDQAAFSSTVAGFGTGDAIVLVGVNADGREYANGTLSLLNDAGNVVATLDFSGTYTDADFNLTGYHGIGTEVVFNGAAGGTGGAQMDHLPGSPITSSLVPALHGLAFQHAGG